MAPQRDRSSREKRTQTRALVDDLDVDAKRVKKTADAWLRAVAAQARVSTFRERAPQPRFDVHGAGTESDVVTALALDEVKTLDEVRILVALELGYSRNRAAQIAAHLDPDADGGDAKQETAKRLKQRWVASVAQEITLGEHILQQLDRVPSDVTWSAAIKAARAKARTEIEERLTHLRKLVAQRSRRR